MAPASIEDFPQEVVDEVIDRIPDKRTLRSLSLVSRAYLPSSQRRLFQSIVLSTGTFVNYPSYDDKGSADPVRFNSLLWALNQSPHLAAYTKEFVILINDGWHHETQAEVMDVILPKIMPFFNFIEKFVWKQIHKTDYIPPVLHREMARIVQLPSLVYVDFKDVPVDILNHCSSSVKRAATWNHALDMNFPDVFSTKSTVTTPGAPPTETIQSYPNLESLLIDDTSHIQNSGQSNEAAIIWILQSNLDTTNLRTLIISVMHCQLKTHAEVAKLLRACPNLVELSFAPTFSALHYDARKVAEPIDLGALKALRTLNLSVQSGFWRDGSELCEPIGWIIGLLEKIPVSNVIKTIIISSSFGMMPTNQSSPDTNYFGVDFKPYSQLDKIANKQNFPKLKQVRFHVEEAPFFKDYVGQTFKVRATWVKSQIRMQMPGLRAALLIRFSSSDDPYRSKLALDSKW